jgi:hypothetical protein
MVSRIQNMPPLLRRKVTQRAQKLLIFRSIPTGQQMQKNRPTRRNFPAR